MVMSWIWTGLAAVSMFSALLLGNGPALGSSLLEGAQEGVNLSVAMAGSICLWSGAGKLMDRIGLTARLSQLLKPVLSRIFPQMKQDPTLARTLSANFCANLLGLGNAATPMGIRAAKQLRSSRDSRIASDQLCRLVVLNTASIQLIPANVAALRVALGCGSPFDILPAVWITSFCSAGLGVAAAVVLGKLWKYD